MVSQEIKAEQQRQQQGLIERWPRQRAAFWGRGRLWWVARVSQMPNVQARFSQRKAQHSNKTFHLSPKKLPNIVPAAAHCYCCCNTHELLLLFLLLLVLPVPKRKSNCLCCCFACCNASWASFSQWPQSFCMQNAAKQQAQQQQI